MATTWCGWLWLAQNVSKYFATLLTTKLCVFICTWIWVCKPKCSMYMVYLPLFTYIYQVYHKNSQPNLGKSTILPWEFGDFTVLFVGFTVTTGCRRQPTPSDSSPGGSSSWTRGRNFCLVALNPWNVTWIWREIDFCFRKDFGWHGRFFEIFTQQKLGEMMIQFDGQIFSKGLVQPPPSFVF